MRKIIGLALALIASPVFAADVATKAPAGNPLLQGYPYASSGWYYGLNTIGGGGPVTASGPGVNPNSITSNQIGVGGQFGYVWANANAFFALEAIFDVNNFNGASQGFSFSGPAMFEQRVKVGTPLANVLAFLPNNPFGGINVPPFPALPNGAVASNVHPYLMAGLHEDDVSINFGQASNSAWQFSPSVGVGMMGQLTNGLAVDVWTEIQFQQNGVCVGVRGGNACGGQGNKYLVGLAFDY